MAQSLQTLIAMSSQPLNGNGTNTGSDNLLARATNHPFLTSGLMMAGAGLAYAAARTISNVSEVARDVHIETSIAIDRPPEELYAFWRDFKNLPLFMDNLESVTELGANRSRWRAKPTNGTRVEWEAEIINEKENELIAWRSLEPSDVVNAGSVRFQKGPQGHGTYIKVTMNCNPPAGRAGAAIASLFGAGPQQLIRDDLRRFKQLMETGEIATTNGQTSGRSEEVEPLEKIENSLENAS
jgi:uncharacterized membrane protein